MKQTKHILLFILILFSFSVLQSKNIYVAMQGSDQNKGGISDPFASVTTASVSAKPGDTVFIRAGGYHVKEQIQIRSSGAPGKWITYMPYPGEKAAFNVDLIPWPTHDQRPNWPSTTTVGAFQIENVSYVRIININILYSHRAGIIVRNSKNIELNGCLVDNTYNSAIGIWYSDSVKVLNCDVSQANDQGKRMPFDKIGREAPHEAISIAGGRYFEVAYNHVYLCYKEGIDCKEVSAHGIIHHNYIHDNSRQGIYVDAWFGLLQDVEVYENTIFRCEYGIGISVECDTSSMENIRFHNNVIYDNRGSGIIIGVWGKNNPRKEIYIYNNTVCNNGSASHWSGATGGIEVRSSNVSDVYIMNNICSGNYAYDIAAFDNPADGLNDIKTKNIIIDNNLITSEKSIQFEKGEFGPVYAYPGTNTIINNPLFADEKNSDFRLNAKSPAINKAKPLKNFITGKNIGAL